MVVMAAISVTTSATLVATGDGAGGAPSDVLLSNDSGDSVYLGKDDQVTTSTGVHLATGSAAGFQIRAGVKIYAIGTGTSEIRSEVWT